MNNTARLNDRIAFIDWMKFLGMLVIVYGHAHAGALLRFSEPFNPKQLGVAFFVFVLGYSLARDDRAPAKIVFYRLFPMLFYGLIVALACSAIGLLTAGNWQESNYLTLALGASVFVLDEFPANPTMWFVGTYMHLVILGVILVRKRTIRLPHVYLCVCLEVAVRAALVGWPMNHFSYVCFTNWVSLLLLGAWAAQRPPVPSRQTSWVKASFVLSATALVAWQVVSARIAFGDGFPFRRVVSGVGIADNILTSLSVTLLYVAFTWLTYGVTKRLPNNRWVELFAGNTLVVFLIHMPLLKLLGPFIQPVSPNAWIRMSVNILIYFVLATFLSAAIQRLINMRVIRDTSFGWLLGVLGKSKITSRMFGQAR